MVWSTNNEQMYFEVDVDVIGTDNCGSSLKLSLILDNNDLLNWDEWIANHKTKL